MSSSSQNPEPEHAKRITLEVSKDGWTGGIQLGISELDENDRGHGYRIGGPKYNGSSKRLLTCELDQRDADEIRTFLDAKFPPKTVDRQQVLSEVAGWLYEVGEKEAAYLIRTVDVPGGVR